jgi:hypothetical protein
LIFSLQVFQLQFCLHFCGLVRHSSFSFSFIWSP